MAKSKEPFWAKVKSVAGKGKKGSGLVSTGSVPVTASELQQRITSDSFAVSSSLMDLGQLEESLFSSFELQQRDSFSHVSSHHSNPRPIPSRSSSMRSQLSAELQKIEVLSMHSSAARSMTRYEPLPDGLEYSGFPSGSPSRQSSLDSVPLPQSPSIHPRTTGTSGQLSSFTHEIQRQHLDDSQRASGGLPDTTTEGFALSAFVERERATAAGGPSSGSEGSGPMGLEEPSLRREESNRAMFAAFEGGPRGHHWSASDTGLSTGGLVTDDTRRILEVLVMVMVAIGALSFGGLAAVVATGGLAAVVLYLQRRYPLKTPSRVLEFTPANGRGALVGPGPVQSGPRVIGWDASDSFATARSLSGTEISRGDNGEGEIVVSSAEEIPTLHASRGEVMSAGREGAVMMREGSSPMGASDSAEMTPSSVSSTSSSPASQVGSSVHNIQYRRDRRKRMFSSPPLLALFSHSGEGKQEHGQRQVADGELPEQEVSEVKPSRSGPLLVRTEASITEVTDSPVSTSAGLGWLGHSIQDADSSPPSLLGVPGGGQEPSSGASEDNASKVADAGPSGMAFMPLIGQDPLLQESPPAPRGVMPAGLPGTLLRQSSETDALLGGQKVRRRRLGRWLSAQVSPASSPPQSGELFPRVVSSPHPIPAVAPAKAPKLGKLFSVRKSPSGPSAKGGRSSRGGSPASGSAVALPAPALALSQSSPPAAMLHTVTMPPPSTVEEAAVPPGLMGLHGKRAPGEVHIFPRFSKGHSGELGRLDAKSAVACRREDGAGAGEGQGPAGSPLVLCLVLVVVLWCLFWGRLHAIIATSLLGLLASQMKRTIQEMDVSAAKGPGRGPGSPRGKTSRFAPEKGKSGSPRTPTIADILQHSHNSDLRTQTILEGLLTRTGRGAS